MAEFPAMPLWTDAYLGDTTHLTTIEHGAYLLLLMIAWRSRDNALPDDDKILARHARLSPQQWRRLRPIIAEFFAIEGGIWRQRRLDDEAKAVRMRREKAAAAGNASALKRKGRHSTPVEPKPNSIPTQPQQDFNLTNTITKEEKDKGKPLSKKTLPDGWVPMMFSAGTKSLAIERRWSTDERAEQLEGFKAHHAKLGSRFVDWQAAWSTWVLNSEKFKRDDGRAQPKPGSYLETVVRDLAREEAKR